MLFSTNGKYSIKVYRICVMPCLIAYACAGAGASDTQSSENLLPIISANNGANKTNEVVATEGKTFPISSKLKGAVKVEDTVTTHIPVAINGSLSQPEKPEQNGSKNESNFHKQPGTEIGYDALRRLLLVSVGITAVVVVYCSIQYIRLRRKKNAALKYGLLASHDEDLEMTPLGADEEEDETTLFDMKTHFVS